MGGELCLQKETIRNPCSSHGTLHNKYTLKGPTPFTHTRFLWLQNLLEIEIFPKGPKIVLI
jgi:hypothetical protein